MAEIQIKILRYFHLSNTSRQTFMLVLFLGWQQWLRRLTQNFQNTIMHLFIYFQSQRSNIYVNGNIAEYALNEIKANVVYSSASSKNMKLVLTFHG